MKSQLCISKKQMTILLFLPETVDFETLTYTTEKRKPEREYMLRYVIWYHLYNFKKREKRTRRSVTFSKVAG